MTSVLLERYTCTIFGSSLYLLAISRDKPDMNSIPPFLFSHTPRAPGHTLPRLSCLHTREMGSSPCLGFSLSVLQEIIDVEPACVFVRDLAAYLETPLADRTTTGPIPSVCEILNAETPSEMQPKMFAPPNVLICVAWSTPISIVLGAMVAYERKRGQHPFYFLDVLCGRPIDEYVTPAHWWKREFKEVLASTKELLVVYPHAGQQQLHRSTHTLAQLYYAAREKKPAYVYVPEGPEMQFDLQVTLAPEQTVSNFMTFNVLDARTPIPTDHAAILHLLRDMQSKGERAADWISQIKTDVELYVAKHWLFRRIEKARSICVSFNKPDKVAYLNLLYLAGTLYKDCGFHAEAEDCARIGLGVLTTVEDKPPAAITKLNFLMGQLLFAQSMVTSATSHFETAMIVGQQNRSTCVPRLPYILDSLGECKVATNDIEGAISVFRMLKADLENERETDSALYFRCIENYSNTLYKQTELPGGAKLRQSNLTEAVKLRMVCIEACKEAGDTSDTIMRHYIAATNLQMQLELYPAAEKNLVEMTQISTEHTSVCAEITRLWKLLCEWYTPARQTKREVYTKIVRPTGHGTKN
jgi:hypothetical protein